MDGKFGCCYKLGSCTQTDNEMNIVILNLLEVVGIIEKREENRENSSDDTKIWSLVLKLLSIDLLFFFLLSLNYFKSIFST